MLLGLCERHAHIRPIHDAHGPKKYSCLLGDAARLLTIGSIMAGLSKVLEKFRFAGANLANAVAAPR